MRGLLSIIGAVLALTASIFDPEPVSAQPFPPPPLTQVGFIPGFGPMCAGFPEPGYGAAHCELVQREVNVRIRTNQIVGGLTQVGLQPGVGPICNGPLGPGPCLQVAHWIAIQEFAQTQIPPLQIIGNAPGVGPICSGPLGPGPCEQVRLYLMQVTAGNPVAAFNFRQPQVVGGSSIDSLMCQGPFGEMPCTIVGQIGLDQMTGNLPSPAAFGVNLGGNPGAIARQCAQEAGLDVATFMGCTGRQFILTEEQQAIVDCAATNGTALDFGKCAAPIAGIRMSNDQRIFVDCAYKSGGNAASLASCAGSQYAAAVLSDEQRAMLDCGASASGNSANFASCAAPYFLDEQQQAVLDCAVGNEDVTSFAACAAPVAGIEMSDDQRILARCALSSEGETSEFLTCASGAYLAVNLGSNERAVLDCAASTNGDADAFAGCAAGRIFGGDLSREQRIALECAAGSGGDAGAFAGCAAGNMFNLQLNPEMQIAVQCVAGTGGNPPAASGCIASRLTIRELTKCLSDGVGGDGCFGDSNDLVGKNGFVRRTMGQIAGGPNSLINNPNQIWGGDNSFVRNPGQIFGGSNSFVRNPGQIFGGSNSVFNNPGQLVEQPMKAVSSAIKKLCSFC